MKMLNLQTLNKLMDVEGEKVTLKDNFNVQVINWILFVA